MSDWHEKRVTDMVNRRGKRLFVLSCFVTIAAYSIYANESLIRDLMPLFLHPLTSALIAGGFIFGAGGLIIGMLMITDDGKK